MGKYSSRLPEYKTSDPMQVNIEVAKLIILKDIANELAEANRLKILELRYIDRANTSEIYFKGNELEDQA